MTAYTALTSGTYLLPGDYIASPDGLYYATIDQTGAAGYGAGVLVVAPGSNPDVAPLQNCLGCTYSVTGTPSENLGGFYAQIGSNGVLNVYTSSSGQPVGIASLVGSYGGAQNPANGPFYAAIQDTPDKTTGNNGGTLVLYQGATSDTSNPLILNGSNVIGNVVSIQLSGGVSGTGVDFDFSKAKSNSIKGVATYSGQLENPTPIQQQFAESLTLNYNQTQTFNFQVSKATAESIGSSVSVGVPGVGSTSINISVTSTTAISKGQATSTSFGGSFQTSIRPEVPPYYVYEAVLAGFDVNYEVPFTWQGIATYEGGATATVTGSGLFKGDQTGKFTAAIYCVQAPDPKICPAIPLVTIEGDALLVGVPEPASALLLSVALLGTVAARRFRRRR